MWCNNNSNGNTAKFRRKASQKISMDKTGSKAGCKKFVLMTVGAELVVFHCKISILPEVLLDGEFPGIYKL